MSVNHVYILGAGFSVPLGGPLFKDLFAMSSLRTLQRHFADEIAERIEDPFIREKWDFVRLFPRTLASMLYEQDNSQGKFVNKWGIDLNAEEILELLEVMLHDKGNWLTKRMQEHAKSSLPMHHLNQRKIEIEIYKLVKVRLALETNLFLQDLLPLSERWEPYDLWFKQLDASSTIITTNYDLVLENLFARARWPELEPRKNKSGIPYAGFPLTPNGPTVLKLHGSCNWYKHGTEVLKLGSFSIETILEHDIVIGTPGVAKQALARSDLEDQWKTAFDKLQKANVISIVGYSLPETDNVLRMWLLDRISESYNLKSVNIVLGSRNERSYRAEEIIRQSMPKKELRDKVFLRNMYAQDFLPMADKLAREAVGG